MRRVKDAEGHEWPLLDERCSVCRWPMIVVSKGQTAHIMCEGEEPS